jgi:hypothetical protein
MYKVTFENGRSVEISDNKYFMIEDARKRVGMLNKRQESWLNTVKSFQFIRTGKRFNEHLIHKTKDIFDGDCSGCQKDAKEYQKNHPEDLLE